MTGIVPPFYSHVDLSNLTAGQRIFIAAIREFEESFEESSTAEDVQESMAGVLSPAAIFNPDVDLLASICG